MDFGKCETKTSNRKIPLEENKSKIVFINENRHEVRKIRIDDCVIKKGIRCDWLLIDYNSIEHYIELKGSDILRAIDQIEATMNYVAAKYKKPLESEKYCYIIPTTCHPKVITKIQNARKKFKRQYGSGLIVKNRYLEVRL